MKKNYYWLLLAIIALGLLLIILIYKYQSEKSDINIPMQTPTNIVFPTEQPIVESNNETLTWDLLDNKVIDDNKSLSWNIIQDQVIDKNEELKKEIIINDVINLAGETGKKESCDDILLNQEQKIKCIDNSYAAKASLENNPDLCSKITDIEWKNKCLDNYYNENALKLQDYKLCKKIINTSLNENCISSIIFQKIESPDFKWWIEICNELNKDNKINCESKFYTQNDAEVLQNAVNSLDINSCSNILNIELKTKCQDVINLKIALNLKDINKCYLITEWDLKTKCTTTLNIINQ
jgi:hypothetical protein